MNFIADVPLISGTLAAGIFCIILSKRLSRLNDLEKGVGGAVSVLSVQVDNLKKSHDGDTSFCKTLKYIINRNYRKCSAVFRIDDGLYA